MAMSKQQNKVKRPIEGEEILRTVGFPSGKKSVLFFGFFRSMDQG